MFATYVRNFLVGLRGLVDDTGESVQVFKMLGHLRCQYHVYHLLSQRAVIVSVNTQHPMPTSKNERETVHLNFRKNPNPQDIRKLLSTAGLFTRMFSYR
jgi:hypothetical protein